MSAYYIHLHVSRIVTHVVNLVGYMGEGVCECVSLAFSWWNIFSLFLTQGGGVSTNHPTHLPSAGSLIKGCYEGSCLVTTGWMMGGRAANWPREMSQCSIPTALPPPGGELINVVLEKGENNVERRLAKCILPRHSAFLFCAALLPTNNEVVRRVFILGSFVATLRYMKKCVSILH